MGKNKGLPRGDLDSRSNKNLGKTLKNGFGIVRMLTTESEQRIFHQLDQNGVSHDELIRRPPLHLTLMGFVGMSRREQAAFHAGFNVARLEERLQKSIEEEAPRRSLTIRLGDLALAGNLVYSKIEDDCLHNEQTHLAGQVALHGISVEKINKNIVPAHIAIGYIQTSPAEEVRERLQDILFDTTVGLQKWNVYPDKYA